MLRLAGAFEHSDIDTFSYQRYYTELLGAMIR